MAKHSQRGRKRFRKYLRGNVDELINLTTLAGRTLSAQVFGETVVERTFLSSIVARYSLNNLTEGANIGPFMVGVAHADYTAAEIEEFIENTGSWDEGDLVNQEIAKRKIKIVGIFPTRASGSANDAVVLNDGKPIKTKCNWILTQGQTLDLWVYNLGTQAVATTVPVLHCEGHANLWPQ